MQGNANVIGNGPVVVLRYGNVFTLWGVKKSAVQVISSFFHQRTKFIVCMNGIDSDCSFVVHSKNFIEG